MRLDEPERAQGLTTLRRVAIPASVLDPVLHRPGRAEARYDLALRGDTIAAITPALGEGPCGGLVLPGLFDAHVHLDKTATFDARLRPAASLEGAIAQSLADKAGWTAEDIALRAEWAMQRAWAHGTVAMRTHVDWRGDLPLAWTVLGEVAARWQGRITLQRANLTPLETLVDREAGPRVAGRVAADRAILGVYIPPVATELGAGLDAVFALAAAHGLDLDFHVDESLEPDTRGLDAIVAATLRHGYEGRVVCGHACALGVRDPDEVGALLARAAAAGLRLVSLPLTNLYLQDRAPQRTPRRRGLGPIQEALHAGLPLSLASDNARDAFHPYGDYDLLEVLRVAVRAAHLDEHLAAHWALVTREPAALMGLPGGVLRPGGQADFVRLAAGDTLSWMARPSTAREVWRAGAPIDPPEPTWPRQEPAA